VTHGQCDTSTVRIYGKCVLLKKSVIFLSVLRVYRASVRPTLMLRMLVSSIFYIFYSTLLMAAPA